MLTLIYLLHEYVAKNLIPYYNLKFEAREAASSLWNLGKIVKNERRNCSNAGNEIGDCQTTRIRCQMDRSFVYASNNHSYPDAIWIRRLSTDRGDRLIDYVTVSDTNATTCDYSERYYIGETTYLTVCDLNGYVILDIRKFINNSASIAGIPLSVNQWISLKRQIPPIDAAIDTSTDSTKSYDWTRGGRR